MSLPDYGKAERMNCNANYLFLRSTFAALGLTVVLLTLGCAPGSGLPLLPDYNAPQYKLGTGDELRIVTYDEDQLSSNFLVNDHGDVILPLVGPVHASGYTIDEFAGKIEQRLVEQRLVKHPSVAIEVRTYRPIFVLGEIAKPGQYTFQPGMTILTAIAIAGGFTYRAEHDYASVVRTTGDHTQTGKVLPQSFVAPGDVINVYARYF